MASIIHPHSSITIYGGNWTGRVHLHVENNPVSPCARGLPLTSLRLCCNSWPQRLLRSSFPAHQAEPPQGSVLEARELRQSWIAWFRATLSAWSSGDSMVECKSTADRVLPFTYWSTGVGSKGTVGLIWQERSISRQVLATMRMSQAGRLSPRNVEKAR